MGPVLKPLHICHKHAAGRGARGCSEGRESGHYSRTSLSSTPTTAPQELALLKGKHGFDFQTSLLERTSCFLSLFFKTDECSPREKAAVNTVEGRKRTPLGVPEEPLYYCKKASQKNEHTPFQTENTQFPVKDLSARVTFGQMVSLGCSLLYSTLRP